MSLTPCILFEGGKDSGGYGCVRYKGRKTTAHRKAYIEEYGELPRNIFVLHKCDNPACINLEHLFPGTHSDNMKDMTAKGRHRDNKGTNYPRVKLSESDVLHIRRSSFSLGALAKYYGVSKECIRKIKKKLRWTHI